MHMLLRGILFAVACFGLTMATAPARPDEKPKVTVEFRLAETKPADGLTEATIEGTKDKIYLSKKAEVTNADIAKAGVGIDNALEPAVDLLFTDAGAKKMEVLTEKHLKKLLAIVIDGKVVSAPVIQSKFSDKCQITGKFSKEEVEKLVKAINGK
jgi:preprotein translocase subunit SecD